MGDGPDREPGLHPFCLNPARGKPALKSTLNLRFSKRITNEKAGTQTDVSTWCCVRS